MYWADGTIYKGDWIKNSRQGYGLMTFPDGRLKEGQFDTNVFQGQTKMPKEVEYKNNEDMDLSSKADQQSTFFVDRNDRNDLMKSLKSKRLIPPVARSLNVGSRKTNGGRQLLSLGPRNSYQIW